MTDQMTLPEPVTGMFPSREHHAALRQRFRQDGTRIYSSDERFHWHAYDYGWRRVMLGDRRQISPIDPSGEWFNEYLADGAEAFWRALMGRPKLARGAPSDPNFVRANWRTIPFHSLTEAEKDLFNESVARMRAAGRLTVASPKRVDDIEDGHAPRPARELTGFSLAPDDSPAVRRLLEEMEAAE